jgi:hypothetical protein
MNSSNNNIDNCYTISYQQIVNFFRKANFDINSAWKYSYGLTCDRKEFERSVKDACLRATENAIFSDNTSIGEILFTCFAIDKDSYWWPLKEKPYWWPEEHELMRYAIEPELILKENPELEVDDNCFFKANILVTEKIQEQTKLLLEAICKVICADCDFHAGQEEKGPFFLIIRKRIYNESPSLEIECFYTVFLCKILRYQREQVYKQLPDNNEQSWSFYNTLKSCSLL